MRREADGREEGESLAGWPHDLACRSGAVRSPSTSGQKVPDRALPASSALLPRGSPALWPSPPIPSCLALWDPREAADPRIQAPGQARACRRHHFLVGGAGLPSAPSGQDALSVPSVSFMEECDTGLSSPPLSPLGTQLSGSPVTSSNRDSEIQGPLALSSLRDYEPPQFPGSPRAQESRHLFPPFSSRAHQL